MTATTAPDPLSPPRRDTYDDAAQDGSQGLAALIAGHDCRAFHMSRWVAQKVMAAGWSNPGVRNPESALANLLCGKDLRETHLASSTVHAMEAHGWARHP